MIKVLTIGNSFSEDCDEWLPAIAASAGISLTLGNLYIGGCSLENHWKHVESGEKDYIYYKWEAKAERNKSPVKQKREGSDILSAVLDEDWDMVTFQQVSGFSGKPETFRPWIEWLEGWVKDKVKKPGLQIGLHMTWSYGEDSDHPDFIRYGKDSLRMYFAIENAYKIISKDIGADFLIPSGRVIQAARREPVLAGIGRDLTRDGFHLELGSGRYLAGLAALFGITGMKEDVLDKVSWYPEELMTKEQKEACVACAKRALKGFCGEFVLEGIPLSAK